MKKGQLEALAGQALDGTLSLIKAETDEEMHVAVMCFPKRSPDKGEDMGAMIATNMQHEKLCGVLGFFAASVEENLKAEDEKKTAVAH